MPTTLAPTEDPVIGDLRLPSLWWVFSLLLNSNSFVLFNSASRSFRTTSSSSFSSFQRRLCTFDLAELLRSWPSAPAPLWPLFMWERLARVLSTMGLFRRRLAVVDLESEKPFDFSITFKSLSVSISLAMRWDEEVSVLLFVLKLLVGVTDVDDSWICCVFGPTLKNITRTWIHKIV